WEGGFSRVRSCPGAFHAAGTRIAITAARRRVLCLSRGRKGCSMRATLKPLQSLTAADLMSRDVTTIPRQMSLQGAAHLLAQLEMSGAPVVDEHGCCTGVLSVTDIVNWTDKGERVRRHDSSEPAGAAHSAWQIMDVEELPVDDVQHFMTHDPVTVTPATPIGELARKMRDAHIHRVIVVDREGRPVGIVSSTDVMAAVAGDAEKVGAVNQ